MDLKNCPFREIREVGSGAPGSARPLVSRKSVLKHPSRKAGMPAAIGRPERAGAAKPLPDGAARPYPAAHDWQRVEESRVARGWTIGGVSERTRAAVTAGAREAGMPVGAWVEQALGKALAKGSKAGGVQFPP
jgi:hypothetical protein